MSFTKNRDTSPHRARSGEVYHPLHETLYEPPQGCVVLYDTDRVPSRLMLLTGDALDQSLYRPSRLIPSSGAVLRRSSVKTTRSCPTPSTRCGLKSSSAPLASCHAGST